MFEPSGTLYYMVTGWPVRYDSVNALAISAAWYASSTEVGTAGKC